MSDSMSKRKWPFDWPPQVTPGNPRKGPTGFIPSGSFPDPAPPAPSCVYKTVTTRVIDHEYTSRKMSIARLAAGLSIREMGRRLGFSGAYVSDLEKNRRKWSEELAARFIKALNKPKPDGAEKKATAE